MAYPGPFPIKVEQGGTGDTSVTANAVVIGDTADQLTSTNVGTNGQLLIGKTAGTPAFASLTSTGGTVTFTAGANSLNLETAGFLPTVFHTGSGDATPSGGAITMAGGSNISTSGSGSTVTYSISGVIPIANGGTNASSMATTDGTVIFDGTSLVTTATGTSGQVLTSNGVGVAPTYQNVSASGAVTSVSAGNNITITGTATAPIVNVSGTTNHALQLGNSTGSLTSLGVASNGQLPIGSTGADPVLATITAGTGISVTNGAGSITITNTSPATGAVTQLDGNTSFAVPVAGVINVVASTGDGTPRFNGTGGGTLTLGFTDSAGNNNIGLGTNSLVSFTTGNHNTAYGAGTLNNLSSGAFNTAIGSNAGTALTTESNNIFINHNGVVADAHTLRIGAATGTGTQGLTSAYICGIDGVNVGSVAKVLTMASDQLGTATITAGSNITITPGANTITIATTGSTGGASTFHTGSGDATASGNAITMAGGNNISTSGSGSTVTYSVSGTTNHTVQVGNASGSLTSLTAGTNGQVLLGATSADPAFITPTAGTGLAVTTNATTLSYALSTPVSIANGGTNATTMATTDGTVIFDGTRLVTTATGTSGQVLTSNGAGVAPTYQAAAASSISITGDSGGALTGNSFTFTGGTTGLTFAGAGTTETLGGTLVVANGGTGAATFTAHSILLGQGTSAVTALGAATNGQIPIGSTGADPVLATITAGSGITVTNGAGSITIAASGGTGITWNEITTTSASMAVNNGYIANNAGLVTLTLPSTAAQGSIIEVTGKGAGGWKIAQNSGQTIYFGTSTTTTGTGGSLASSATRDGIRIVCITANNDFNVLSVQGNLTVV